MMKTLHVERAIQRNPLLALLAAPLAGLALVVFLPVIGFVVTGQALLERVHAEARAFGRRLRERGA